MKYLFFVNILLLLIAGCGGSAVVKEGVDTDEAANVNAELGMRYMLQGNNELAMTKLKRALEFEPDNVSANHYLGELYRRLDRPDDAERYYRVALRYSKPEDSQLFNNYGAFLCSQGRFRDGEEQFLKVLDNPLYQRRDQVYENLGICMARKPDQEKAVKYLRAALQLNPRTPGALLELSKLYFEQKNYMSARAYLQRFQSVARHTAESLWLGIRVERFLGDQNALASYGVVLKGRFPDAEETRLYLESGW